MKLERRPNQRPDRIQAISVLRQETEPGFDLRKVVASKLSEINQEIATRNSETPIQYSKALFWRLANVRVVEQALGVKLLTPETTDHVSQMSLPEDFTLSEEPPTSVIGLGKFAQAVGWVQCYPEERDRVRLTDEEFERAWNSTSHQRDSHGFLRDAVFLLHLRPDKRDEIRKVVTPQYFQEYILSRRGMKFLFGEHREWLADYLLIRPEDREQFLPSVEFKREIEQSLTQPSNLLYTNVGRLRDVAIIFSNNAYIDDWGVIQISYSAPMGGKRQLPERSHM